MVSRADIFKEAAGRLIPAMEALENFKENALQMGIKSGSNDESVYRSISPAKYAELCKNGKKEDKARRDQQRFIDLLAQLDIINDRINDNLKSLKDKYGEDVIGGMAEAYLTPEELQGLNTDEEKMQILTKKMVDESGNIKPEYAGLDPREIQILQDWYKREEIKLEAQEINKGVAQKGPTQEFKENAADIAQSATAGQRVALHNELGNSEVKDIVDKEHTSAAVVVDKAAGFFIG